MLGAGPLLRARCLSAYAYHRMQDIATRVCEALARQGDTPTLIETHISWVVPSPSFGYKIKNQ